LKPPFPSATTQRANVFTDIWARNGWQGTESRSGPGSGVARTAEFRAAFELFLERERPRTLFDAPCGDFVWMRHVHLPAGTAYVGADIVAPMIIANTKAYAREGVSFAVADIVDVTPPETADVWLCRESLFHLPLADAQRVIAQWRASSVRWFLATTTPTIMQNTDIAVGGWRPLNLELAPFSLGAPLERIPDGSPADPSKIVGAWRQESK
jgi:hypothetical protein